MREHYIHYTYEMRQARREGRKTQTRRVIKKPVSEVRIEDCPYGRPGDALYVSEPIEFIEIGGTLAAIHYLDDDETRIVNIPERIKYPSLGRWRGRTLPPEWARDRDEIVDIRIEMIQDITYDDIIAEGWHARNSHGEDARDWYRNLWNLVIGIRGYGCDTNPICWVIEFKETNEAKKLRG